MNAIAGPAWAARAVDAAGDVVVDLPGDWVVEVGPPTVARPAGWSGVAPAVVVVVEPDVVRGDDLAAAVVGAALARLGDPVVVDVRCPGDDVEIVVAHRHWGVDVTTVERHRCLGPRGRWIVSCSVPDTDLAGWAGAAQRIVASLAVVS